MLSPYTRIEVSPMPLAAFTVTFVRLVSVAPFSGAVIETVGFATVTLTPAEVVLLPAASRATAVSVWAALVAVAVFQEKGYGAAGVSAPRLAPSSLNSMPTSLTLSVAFADTVIVPETVAPADGAAMETVGGVVSATVTLTAAAVAVLPAASLATAVSVCAPMEDSAVFQLVA